VRRTRIKFCGLTRVEDVKAAVAVGADACGFILAESPRRLSVDRVAELAAFVPPPVARIGVFVDAELAFVEEVVRAAGLTAVQFSGAETPAQCAVISVPVIKTIHVGTDFDWKVAEPYRGRAAVLLLDTYDPQRAGGTSREFAWRSLGEPPGWASVFVAGGLGPRNVEEAVSVLRPFGLDISSGIETAPGVKDYTRMVRVCEGVRAADKRGFRR
jgi:phosphoribosylanthranilate isomerase